MINGSTSLKDNVIPPRPSTQAGFAKPEKNDSDSGEFHELPDDNQNAVKAFRKSITEQAKTKIQLTFKNVVITADVRRSRREPVVTKTIIDDVSGTIMPG